MQESSHSGPSRTETLVLAAIGQVVEHRFVPAQQSVRNLKSRHPNETPEQLADRIADTTKRNLALLGGATGAAAAVPGFGTIASAVAQVSEIGAVLEQLAEMILKIACAYGLDLEDVEARTAVIMIVLAGGGGTAKVGTKVADIVGKGVGAKAMKKVSGKQLQQINRMVGRTLFTKYGTKRGGIALGKALPFGIGAGIGAVGNYASASSVAKVAKNEFARVEAVGSAESAVPPSGRVA